MRRQLGQVDDLTTVELDLLAVASYLAGCDDDAVAAWERVHHACAGAGDDAGAALAAFWVGFCWTMQGQMGHAGGWFGRAETIVADVECVAAGYLLIPPMLGALNAGEAVQARGLAERAHHIAERFGDKDLLTFASLGEGQARIAEGDDSTGVGRLDEVMVAVVSGEVGPIASGVAYCAVLLVCMELFDLARASEWTAALDTWCTSQPDLVPYRGQCLVHQAQLQQVAGDWATAMSTAAEACARLQDPPHPALGLACYQQGELHRLRGEFDAAADAYRAASRAGYPPMPGLALLEWRRGQTDDSAASLRRALVDAVRPFQRPPLLAAAVEVLTAADDLAGARSAAHELGQIADGSSSDVIGAMADEAEGAVLLAAGDARNALAHLRKASEVWGRLHLPYESARTATLLGQACAALGDDRSAELELDRARDAFETLGAIPDLQALGVVPRLQQILDRATSSPGRDGVLSERELEVLAQVAQGRTNRQIAAALSISPHTVGRHLENIFVKFGVSSRAAATAFGYEHDLL